MNKPDESIITIPDPGHFVKLYRNGQFLFQILKTGRSYPLFFYLGLYRWLNLKQGQMNI